jgi:hypothetical protein
MAATEGDGFLVNRRKSRIVLSPALRRPRTKRSSGWPSTSSVHACLRETPGHEEHGDARDGEGQPVTARAAGGRTTIGIRRIGGARDAVQALLPRSCRA